MSCMMWLQILALKLKDIVSVLRPVSLLSALKESVDTETGPGVYETALAYTDASRMADNGVLFKLVAKNVGMKYGIMPTFMAKPWGDVRVPFILAP